VREARELTIRLFVSYAKADKRYFKQLMPTLEKCKREFGIIIQSDQNIPPGTDWDRWIANALSEAEIILCLISTEYFASQYLTETEVPLIHKRCETGVPCIPIFVKYCRLDESSLFHSREGMNTPERPISDMLPRERDRFFANVERDLGTIRNEIILERTRRSESLRSKVAQSSDHISQNDMESARYNIVFVGRTGVGKSALINYLFGAQVRDSGTGLPVTKRGFHRQDADIGGVPSTIFDSWGLETAGADIWLKELELELSKRGTDKPVKKWFHTVVYCLQASSHRVEPFEIQILQKFRRENYRVIVTLTKADAVSKRALEILDSTIRSEVEDGLRIIPVCSVEEETMTGRTARFGIQDLIGQIRRGFWESIMDRVPSRCISLITKHVDEECDKLISFVEEQTGLFNHKRIAREVNSRLSNGIRELSKPQGIIEHTLVSEVENTLALYEQFEKLINHSAELANKFSSGKYLDATINALEGSTDTAEIASYGLRIAIAGASAYSAGTFLSAGGLFAGLSWIAGPISIGLSAVIALKIKERFL
jgi:GTP-binding protein EngB required for normal cell division